MSDDTSDKRSPFGSRDGSAQQPFGSKGAYRRRQNRFLRSTPPPSQQSPTDPPPQLAPLPEPEADDLDDTVNEAPLPAEDIEPEEDLLFYDGDITDTFDVDLLEEAIKADQERLAQQEATADVELGALQETVEEEETYAALRRSYEPEPEDQEVALNPIVLFRSAGLMAFGAAVVATMFTWWSPNAFLSDNSIEQLSLALATQSSQVDSNQPAVEAPPPSTLIPATPTLVPIAEVTPKIGIVSGHLGLNPSSGLPDPGAVCPDGLTERDVNYEVATRVVELLEAENLEVELLEEFDDRLQGYQAQAVVSIHADSCEFYNEFATGYKVASFLESQTPDQDEKLVQCLSNNYASTTGLGFHPSITYDMTQYHNFREVAPQTPGAIIELGFLYLDRDFLTGQPEVAAEGIYKGILCYLSENEKDDQPAATPEDQASATEDNSNDS